MNTRQKIMLAVAAAVSFWASAAQAQDVDAVMERYVVATGGRAAYERIQNRVSKFRMEIVGQGIVLKGESINARPNRIYTVMQSDLTGKLESGSDGETVWSNSATTGPQRLEGAQRSDMLLRARLDRYTEWRAHYPSARLAGEAEADGRPCTEVVLTPRDGRPETLCFDKETGLLTRLAMTVSTPGGDIAVETVMSDYRDVDGIRMPFQMKSRLPGQERLMRIESVSHNADIPGGRFAPPAGLPARN